MNQRSWSLAIPGWVLVGINHKWASICFWKKYLEHFVGLFGASGHWCGGALLPPGFRFPYVLRAFQGGQREQGAPSNLIKINQVAVSSVLAWSSGPEQWTLCGLTKKIIQASTNPKGTGTARWLAGTRIEVQKDKITHAARKSSLDLLVGPNPQPPINLTELPINNKYMKCRNTPFAINGVASRQLPGSDLRRHHSKSNE